MDAHVAQLERALAANPLDKALALECAKAVDRTGWTHKQQSLTQWLVRFDKGGHKGFTELCQDFVSGCEVEDLPQPRPEFLPYVVDWLDLEIAADQVARDYYSMAEFLPNVAHGTTWIVPRLLQLMKKTFDGAYRATAMTLTGLPQPFQLCCMALREFSVTPSPLTEELCERFYDHLGPAMRTHWCSPDNPAPEGLLALGEIGRQYVEQRLAKEASGNGYAAELLKTFAEDS